MALTRPTNGYDKLSDAKLLEKGYFIHGNVSTRTSVFATPTPTMTVLKDLLDDYQSATNLALSRDIVMVQQKKDARKKVIDKLHQLSYYVMIVADGARTIAVESGILLAKEPTSVVIVKPTDVKAEYTGQPGELLLSAKTVKGAAAYVHQYTTDPLLKEESWVSMNCTSSKCKLTGLTPGTTYYLRVGAVGTKDQVLFSDVISKLAA